MTYLSESEDSEHSLEGGVIQYVLYFQYTCLLASRGGGLYPFHCRVDIPQLRHSVSKRMEKSALSQTL